MYIIVTQRHKYNNIDSQTAQNGGGEKLWQIWQNKRNLPIFYPAKLQIHLIH